MMSRIWAPYHDSDKQTAQHAISKREVYGNMMVASSSAQSFTILTENAGFQVQIQKGTGGIYCGTIKMVAEVPRIEAEWKKRVTIKSCQRLHCEWESPESRT